MKLIALVGILAAAAMLVAACGGGAATPSPTGTTDPTATPTTPAAASEPRHGDGREPTPKMKGTPAPTSEPTATPTPTPPATDDSVTTTPGAQDETLRWLNDLIRVLENEPVANPPRSIVQYAYKGQMVYYLPPPCCDIFSDLYDADGNLLGHPDGGITGQGDGQLPDFREERADEKTFWADDRKLDEGMVLAPDPIEELELLVLESFPLQYQLQVNSSLPNGCYRYGGYFKTRAGTTISIDMVNWGPSDPRVVRCTQVFGTVETFISLGSGFDFDTTYTVDVNGTTLAFKGDQVVSPPK